jgi:hypothetical protein
LDQIPHNRRACRRHALAANAVVDKRKAFEEKRSRGRRHGQEAMRRANPPTAQRDRPDGPVRRSTPLNQKRGADDVRNRIPSADFMELDIVNIAAMNARLRFRQQREDRERAALDGRIERRSVKLTPYEAPIDMRVVVSMSVLRCVVSGYASLASFDVKALAHERPIADAFYSARHAFEQGSGKAQVLLNARLEMRRQIDEPSDEHIA